MRTTRLVLPAVLLVSVTACDDSSSSNPWRQTGLEVVDTGTLANIKASACDRGGLLGIEDGTGAISRIQLVSGAIQRVTSVEGMGDQAFTFLSTRMEVHDARLYVIYNRNDVTVWDVAGEVPVLLGRYLGIPGTAFPLGEGYVLHADPTAGRIVDARDPAAPVTLFELRLRRDNTVTGVRAGARRGDDLVLLANEGFEFHRFAWSDVLAAAARTDLPSNILEDWYPVRRAVSRFERATIVSDGTRMVANLVGDPGDPMDANRDALPAVIDPATGELLADGDRAQQGNGTTEYYEHSAYVRPVLRGGEWFQIGPGLNGLWSEVVHVDVAGMVNGVSAADGVTPILPRDAIDYTELCWFPDEGFGMSVRQYVNESWGLARWERAAR